MKNSPNRSRRTFLMNLARAGMLLPFAGQMLGQQVLAQTSGAQRVLFLYYPNGVVPYNWRPVQDNGSISNGTELSFGLGPLKDWHNRMIVLDRKSTRLNSSHVKISYAVFCLKKKK